MSPSPPIPQHSPHWRVAAHPAPGQTRPAHLRGVAIATAMVLVVFSGLFALGRIPSVGLWVASLVPFTYGLAQLIRRRQRWAKGLMGGAATMGLVGLVLVPVTAPATPAVPAPVSSTDATVASPVASAPRPSPTATRSSEASASTSAVPSTMTTSTSAAMSAGISAAASSAVASSGSASSAASGRSPVAVALVLSLTVKGRGPQTGYDRDLFGWNSYDFDRNGCDQRNDVLRRDTTNTMIRPGSNGCYVVSGTLQDRYTGKAYPLPRADIQIDHLVPLSNAWQMGAAGWTHDARLRFANDPLNLIATRGTTNASKGGSDAATWLPPNKAYRCEYVTRQAQVKARYGLAVTAAERDAMLRVLAACPEQGLVTGAERAPAMATTAAPTPSVAPTTARPPASTRPPLTVVGPTTTGSLDPRFSTCKKAKAAGYGPYVKGTDPEYAWYIDRDSDGIVCE